MKKALLIFVLFGSVFVINCEARDAEVNKREYQFFKENKTFIKNPFKLRDPFKRKVSKVRLEVVKKKSSFFTGVLDNEPSLDGVRLDQIRVVGVLLGKDRRAIARITSGEEKLSEETYILREGMTIGADRAEIRAILPGGIVLVEKIRNVYDKDEYLETVIPISSD